MALATTLAIEVAKEIRDAFEKVNSTFRLDWGCLISLLSQLPQNYECIRRLASEIVKTVQKMNKLYTEKKDVFESSPDLQESLSDLRQYVHFEIIYESASYLEKKIYNEYPREMIDVYRRCGQLIPPISERKRDKFKVAFYSFWRREEIQRLIFELKNHIDNCYKQFTVSDCEIPDSFSPTNYSFSCYLQFALRRQSIKFPICWTLSRGYMLMTDICTISSQVHLAPNYFSSCIHSLLH